MLDAYLAQDPNARVACETLVTSGYVCIAGEVGSRVNLAQDQIARWPALRLRISVIRRTTAAFRG